MWGLYYLRDPKWDHDCFNLVFWEFVLLGAKAPEALLGLKPFGNPMKLLFEVVFWVKFRKLGLRFRVGER